MAAVGVLEPVVPVDSRRLDPRALLGFAGAAAVFALALTPLSQRALAPLPMSRASEPLAVVEPPPVSPAVNPALRFDLSDDKPTFQTMADRLPAIEGQPPVEPPSEALAPLEPVAPYAALAALAMPVEATLAQVGETVEAPIGESPPAPHLAEKQAGIDVATTGSYADPDTAPPQRNVAGQTADQVAERSRDEPVRTRLPRAASRSATEPRPSFRTRPPQPSSQISRESGPAARPARHAATVPASNSALRRSENRTWSLPRELLPTGL